MKITDDLKFKARCYFEREDWKATIRVLLSDGTSAVILYRIARFFSSIHLGPVGWIFLEFNRILNGCVIGRNADFGKGFVIMHPYGVVINGGVVGGKNVVIESGVVIGAARNGLPVEVPTLGNNVFIGAGAKLLGDIKIGNNVKIGANAVVVKDVPDGSTAVGIPAKIIKNNGKTT